jgi:hypothetical protein
LISDPASIRASLNASVGETTMHEPASAQIIAFPRARASEQPRDPGRERLLAALASLEEALAVQRRAIAEWRGSLTDLRGAVDGLGGSLRRYRDRLGALGERPTELDTQARQLENLTAQPGA